MRLDFGALTVHHLLRTAEGLVHRSQDHILQHIYVLRINDLGIDDDRQDLLLPG